MLIRGSAHEEEIHKYVNVDVMVHDNGGKWYLWYECVVFHKFPNWLYFEYGDWRTVDGLCTNDVINSDGKNYQEIFRVFHLRGRRPPKVLLVVLCFFRYLNLSLTEELIITGYRSKKGSMWGNSIVGSLRTRVQILNYSLKFHEIKNLSSLRCTFMYLLLPV